MALIIVLGFLTILVLLGTSFAILMRTERAVASSYADSVAARQFLRVGLTRALRDVEQDLSTRGRMVPDWSAFPSSDPGADFFRSLLSGTVTNHVPSSLKTGVEQAADNVKWVKITDPVSNDEIGRVSYLVVDCSRFLDASQVGKTNAAWGIYSPLRPEGVTEFSGASFGAFMAERDTVANPHVRYENLHELEELTEPSGLMTKPIRHFFTYSRSWGDERVVGLGQPVVPKVNLAEAYSNSNWTAINTALTAAGVPNVARVSQNLMDYCDPDNVPQNVDDFMTEAVPMINEVQVRSEMTVNDLGGGNFELVHDFTITVETWYPFPYTSAATPFPSFEVRLVGGPTWNTLQPSTTFSGVTAVGTPSAWNPAPYSLQQHQFEFEERVTTTAPPPGMGYQVVVGQIEVVDSAAGVAVDRVQLNNVVAHVLRMATGENAATAFSVTDPRMNYLTAEWSQQTPSLGSINPIAVAPVKGEGISEMFVRNGTPHSIHELGFLSVGSPWTTIALYPNAVAGTPHRVLDYFRYGNPPQRAARGLVSLNARNLEVLSAPFDKQPVQQYPGQTGAYLDWNQARAMGQVLLDRSTAQGQLLNLSEVGYSANALPPEWSDALKESVIGNAVSHFTARQNIFTIIVAAESLREGLAVSHQRALYIVSRDPYPEGSPRYEYPLVRHVKFLYD